MNTEHVPRPPAVAEIKKSAWKRAPPVNSPNAETVEEIRGLVYFARTVGRDMAIFISRTVCMEAKLDGKLPRKLHRLVRVTPQVQNPLSPYGEVGACRPGEGARSTRPIARTSRSSYRIWPYRLLGRPRPKERPAGRPGPAPRTAPASWQTRMDTKQ
jgi:hypothetical protein